MAFLTQIVVPYVTVERDLRCNITTVYFPVFLQTNVSHGH